MTYPCIVGRSYSPETGAEAITIRLSECDVIHLDGKPGAHISDDEAIAGALWLRYHDEPERAEEEFRRWEESQSSGTTVVDPTSSN